MTKGDPALIKLFENFECTLTESYVAHNHGTKDLKAEKNQMKQKLKDAVAAAEPSSSSKSSVAREQLNKHLSPDK